MEATTNWEGNEHLLLAGGIHHFSHCTKPQDNQCSLNTQNKGPAWLSGQFAPGHSGHHLPQGWGSSKNQNWYRKLLHCCLFLIHCSLGPKDEGIPRQNEIQQDHSVQQHSTERKVRKNMKKKAYLISAELPEPQWLPWGKKRDGEIMSISSIIFVTFIFTVFWARLPRWSKLTAYDGL